MKSNPLSAYAGSILVTILWSSYFVLIKYGLSELPPFLFAAVRYTVAFLLLAIVFAGSRKKGNTDESVVTLIGGKRYLLAAGVFGYTLSQGLNFLGLFYMPAVTASFILNFTQIFVLLLGILLNERVSKLQLAGLAIALGGAYAFFQGRMLGAIDLFGVMIVVAGGVSWAVYLIIVRRAQRASRSGSLGLTTLTMGIGTGGPHATCRNIRCTETDFE